MDGPQYIPAGPLFLSPLLLFDQLRQHGFEGRKRIAEVGERVIPNDPQAGSRSEVKKRHVDEALEGTVGPGWPVKAFEFSDRLQYAGSGAMQLHPVFGGRLGKVDLLVDLTLGAGNGRELK